MKQHGTLACEAWGFDFQAVYGELDEGFIACHHTVPVSQLQLGQTTRVNDLALLCANRHRMMQQQPMTDCNTWGRFNG